MPKRLTKVEIARVLASGGLAQKVAWRYWRHLDPETRSLFRVEDLVQEAALGVCEAAQRFDPRRGVRFSTYASRTALGRCLHYVRDMRFIARTGRPGRRLVVPAPVLFDDEELGEIERGFGQAEIRAILSRELGRMSETVRWVLVWTAAGLTQRETARRLGITQRHVSRVWKRVRDRLRI